MRFFLIAIQNSLIRWKNLMSSFKLIKKGALQKISFERYL